MAYRLSPPGMFAVPNAVVDEHLKLARDLHLKVLLWLCRHESVQGLEALAQWLCRPEGELTEAMQFWIDRGVVQADATARQPEPPQAPPAQPAAAPPVPATPPAMPNFIRPSPEELRARMAEDERLHALFGAADKTLGRSIGYEGQCVLLLLHDTHGLPVEVIFMLLDYCAEMQKTNNAYIEAVGRDWGAREIDSIEKAGEVLAALKENLHLWAELRRMAGLHAPKPTRQQAALLQRWTHELGFGLDLITAAYEEMANHTGKLSFGYMDKVLTEWHKAGVQTVAGIEAAKAVFRERSIASGTPKRAKAPPPEPATRSYDLTAIEQEALRNPFQPPKIQRKR